MAKQIVIEIDEDGNIKIETLGFTGRSCLTESKWLKELLGEEVSKQLTPAYWMKETDKVLKKKHLPLCG